MDPVKLKGIKDWPALTTEGTTTILRLYKLLLMIYSRIWKFNSPTKHPSKENQKIQMDPRMLGCKLTEKPHHEHSLSPPD